jgi:hypothetical protein
MDAEPTLAEELHRLVGLVRRLNPNWRDAEAFYELRSEVTGGLTRLVRRLSLRPDLRSLQIRPPALPLKIRPAAPPQKPLQTVQAIPRIQTPPRLRPAIAPRMARQKRSVAGRRHRYPLPPAGDMQTLL